MSRFIQIDCHLKDKPEIVEMRMLLGLEDNAASNATILGPLVLMWSYAQIHAEKDGKIKMRWEFMPQMFGGTAEFWDACKEVGWITYENSCICVSKWEETFYSKTSAGRSKKYRDEQKETKRAHASACERSEYTLEQNEQNAAPRIDKIREDKIIKEERIEEAAPAANLSSDLFEFKKNLQAAGMEVGTLPGWLSKTMSNGHASTYLKASRELAHTDLLSGDSPSHLGNFKNTSWVQRVANGEFSKGGPAPQAEPEDPMEQWVQVHAAGTRMKRKDAIAWTKDPANAEYIEIYKSRSQKNAGRDAHRGDTPPEGTPLPAAVPRPTLKDPNESFDTEGARERELAKLAQYLKK